MAYSPETNTPVTEYTPENEALNYIIQTFHPNKCRAPVVAAIKTIMSRHCSGEVATAICLPPRTGKTDVMRLTAVEAIVTGVASATLAAAPWLNLVSQMVDPKKMAAMAERCMLPLRQRVPMDIKMEELDELTDNFHHREPILYLASTTIHHLMTRLDVLSAWIQMCILNGRRPIVFIDEAHLTSEHTKSRFGDVVRESMKNGAHVVLLTGTPYRGDNEDIPGFIVEEIDQEEVERVVARVVARNPDANTITLQKDLYKGFRRIKKLSAHYTFPLRDAWLAGYLCWVELDWIDAEATVDKELTVLSKLSIEDARKVLRRVLTQESTVEIAVEKALQDWSERVSLWKARGGKGDKPGIMFITCSDDSGENEGLPNYHARRIRDCIRRHDENVSVLIATMASDDGSRKGDAGRRNMDRFSGYFDLDGKWHSPEGDVIIVKNMGTVGFDCARLKTVVMLSATRQAASWLQAVLRGATKSTPDNEVERFKLILPCDKMSVDNVNIFIRAEGGDEPIKSEHLKLVSSSTTEKPDEPDKNRGVGDAFFSGTTDNHPAFKDLFISAQESERIRKLIDSNPQLKPLGDAGVFQLYKDFKEAMSGVGGNAPPEEPKAPGIVFSNDTKKKQKAKNAINKSKHEITRSKLGSGYSNEEYGLVVRQVISDAKRYAGINPRISLKNIPLEGLLKMQTFLAGVEASLKKGAA